MPTLTILEKAIEFYAAALGPRLGRRERRCQGCRRPSHAEPPTGADGPQRRLLGLSLAFSAVGRSSPGALAMIKSFTLFLAALLFVAIPVALTDVIGDARIRGGVLVGAILGLITLYALDRTRERRDTDRAQDAAGERLDRLLRLASNDNLELEVRGSHNLRLAWIGLLCGLVLLFCASVSASGIGLWIVFAALFAIPSALLVILMWPGRNKPVIVLSKAGFTTPWTGRIPWHFVHGIDIREVSVGSTHFHLLIFDIPGLRQLFVQFSPVNRWVWQRRPQSWSSRFQVMLKETTEQPEVVFQIARALWTESTGRTHYWNSSLAELRRYRGLLPWLKLFAFAVAALYVLSVIVKWLT